MSKYIDNKTVCHVIFDGDTISIRGVFTDEANQELKEFKDSKRNYIGLSGKNVRLVEGDSVHSLYCITKILEADKDKLIKPIFK